MDPETKDDGYCEGCDYEPVFVKNYERSFPRLPSMPQREPIWLCKLCAGTPAGNVAAYPGSEDHSTVALLRTINYGNNEILAELRKNGGSMK